MLRHFEHGRSKEFLWERQSYTLIVEVLSMNILKYIYYIQKELIDDFVSNSGMNCWKREGVVMWSSNFQFYEIMLY